MHTIIGIVVLLLGVYMVVAFNGDKLLVPPVVSGIALILIGVQSLLPLGKRRHEVSGTDE